MSQVLNSPLTLDLARTASPELLRNDVDKRIVKLRPMATPVDQISRFADVRPCSSMVVDYYAVASRPSVAKVTTALSGATISGSSPCFTLNVDPIDAFGISETVMLPTIGSAVEGEPLICYVQEIDTNSQTVTLRPINPADGSRGDKAIPAIAKDTEVVRMGRAAGELDVQTGQYEAMPEKCNNYCQIFKTQIEQSMLMKSANKEVNWTLSDQEEVAIFDMRLGMERSFLFGHLDRFTDASKRAEIYLTQGIWYQAGKEATYTSGALTEAEMVKIMSKAFTGQGGSSRKILVAGTQLVEQLSKLEGFGTRMLNATDRVSRWGLDFHEMTSKFGTLYVIHSEVLDSCGHSADGLIIDPEFLTKYVHVPFSATTLDLRTSGQRNSEAVVLTEVSCLVLRYPEAHMRLIAQTAES